MFLALASVYTVVVVLLMALAGSTLAWMLFAWRHSHSLADTHWRGGRDELSDHSRLSFSLLVPARHEEGVLESTLRRLVAMEHDWFEIIVIVGHDDPGTTAIAHRCAEQYPERIRVVVDYSPEKNKPRALNVGLTAAMGDVIGVFDAEDVVHPRLLAAVERQMVTESTAALQAGVQLMNYWSNWFAVRNVLEYYFWFRSRLHFQASKGFIPLGGNTVFVRRRLLKHLNGWDSDCLAEDCDLGVRLSARGFKVSVAYDADLVTREETPATLGAFIRQRTRWNQGFLQVLFKGDWKVLPDRRQRALALYTLCTPFIQAATGLILPVAVVMMVVGRMPVGIAILSFLPLLPTTLTVAIEHLALQDFARLYGLQTRLRDHAKLFLGTPLFQCVLAFAALRAVFRHYRGQQTWDKTAHLGLHLDGAVAQPQGAAS